MKYLKVLNTPAMREVIKHGYNGFLVRPNDVDELANALLLLYKNEDLRKSLSYNARLFAEQYLDWDKIARKTFGIYREII